MTTDKTKHKFLIGETSVADGVENDAPYCVVEICEKTLAFILDWMRKFEKGGPLELASSVSVHDCDAVYLNAIDKLTDELPEDQDIIVGFGDLLRHPDELAAEREGGSVVRTELDAMDISGRRVRWVARFKYSDHEIEGPMLTRTQVEELLADFAKETT